MYFMKIESNVWSQTNLISSNKVLSIWNLNYIPLITKQILINSKIKLVIWEGLNNIYYF